MNKKLYSILNNKCPRCHYGDFFIEKNPYKNLFSKAGNANEKCSKCNLKFELEPGFFWGSMYINYAISVFIGLVTFLILYFFTEISSLIGRLIVISSILIVSAPITYYLGRLIWLNIFVNYNSNFGNENNN